MLNESALFSQSRLGVLQLLHGGRRGHAQLLHEDHHRAPSQTEAPAGGGPSHHPRPVLRRGGSGWRALLGQRLVAVSGQYGRRGVGPKRKRGGSGKRGRAYAGFGGGLRPRGLWRLREGDGRDGRGHGPSGFSVLRDRYNAGGKKMRLPQAWLLLNLGIYWLFETEKSLHIRTRRVMNVQKPLTQTTEASGCLSNPCRTLK